MSKYGHLMTLVTSVLTLVEMLDLELRDLDSTDEFSSCAHKLSGKKTSEKGGKNL